MRFVPLRGTTAAGGGQRAAASGEEVPLWGTSSAGGGAYYGRGRERETNGVDDVVVANLRSSCFHVLFSAGGTPRLQEVDLEHPASAIALGDVDDDGDLDVLLRRSVIHHAFRANNFPRNELFVFENLGDGELRHLSTHSFDEDGAP